MPASRNSALPDFHSALGISRETLLIRAGKRTYRRAPCAIARPKSGGEGFEPSGKSVTADLQSAPLAAQGTPPDLMVPTTGIELVTY